MKRTDAQTPSAKYTGRVGRLLQKIEDTRAARWADYRRVISTVGPKVMRALRADHYITRDIRAKLIALPERGLTPRQQDLLLKLEQQVEERKNQKFVAIPKAEGRLQIVGKIVSVKPYEGQFGRSLKMVVRVETDEGAWMCWGTFPDSLEREADRAWGSYRGATGATISFEASLKGGGNDEHFGFFKRPSKAEFVGRIGLQVALEKFHSKEADPAVDQDELDQKENPLDYVNVTLSPDTPWSQPDWNQN